MLEEGGASRPVFLIGSRPVCVRNTLFRSCADSFVLSMFRIMVSVIEQARLEAALAVLAEARDAAHIDQQHTAGVRLALRVLRRHVDDSWLKLFWDAAGQGNAIGRAQSLNASYNGIERNLRARQPGGA